MTTADIARVIIGAVGFLTTAIAFGVLQKRKERINRRHMVPVTPYFKSFCVGNAVIFMGTLLRGLRHTLLQGVPPMLLDETSDLGLVIVIATLIMVLVQVFRLHPLSDDES